MDANSGLLGLLGVSSGDPQKDAALNHGLLQAGLTLLQSRGRLGPALGQAGMAGLTGMQQFQDHAYKQNLQQAQVDELKRKQEQQKRSDAFRDSLVSPQMQASQGALAGGGGPTMANAAKMPATDPSGEMLFGAMKAGLIDPAAYISSIKKDTTPIPVKEGEVLLDPHTRKPIFSNPKADKDDPFVRLLKQSGIDINSPEGRLLLAERLKKETTHQPATTVNVSTDKAFGTTLAEGLGKQIDTSLGNAKAAVSSIQTAQRLKSAIDSGKIVAGPGASFKVLGLQIGQMLGVGGKDAAETLLNTRTAIQGMAQAELDAANQMKGQGQITESERDIIRRAAAGEIDKLTSPEMRQLADTMEKTARFKIQAHRSNVGRLKKVPGTETLLPFYQLDEPPAYVAPGQQRVRRFNPATGQLEE